MRGDDKDPVVYRAAVPGVPGELKEVEAETIQQALEFARHDIQVGLRPIGVFRGGVQVYDEEGVRDAVAEMFGEEWE